MRILEKVTPEALEKIEQLSRDGLTQFYVAAHFGLAEKSWYERCASMPEFSQAYWRGKAKGVEDAVNCIKKGVESNNQRSAEFYLRYVAKYTDQGKPQDEDVNQFVPKETPDLSTTDPAEAARIYQRIMKGE